jgi:hypothetical protein
MVRLPCYRDSVKLSKLVGVATLIWLFNATWAAAQGLDPRCSNRMATGQIICIIDKPDVTRHETVYLDVVFAPGDTVVVGARGCVQTGGFGDTWKRYVDPVPDNSYHGLVRIPTATPGTGLVRIKDFKDQNLTVTGAGAAQSALVLHLGYEDDDYSDNGYYSHDDGTDDQCKNIGPAQVTIVIYRNVAPPPQSRFDFNLEWTAHAPGGLPLNPQWAWQGRVQNLGAIPDTGLCHNFSKSVTVGGSTVRVPDFSDCTDQTDLNHVDLPEGFNAFICGFGGTDSFHGHLNWFPVTFDGTARWGGHNTDDDYTFEFKRAGNPLSVNGRAGLHVEFDSDETIDHFTTTEWNTFHAAVDVSTAAKTALASCTFCNDSQRTLLQEAIDFPHKLFDGQTILTGMFGLDCEHNCKGELHPLYAMATKRDFNNNNPEDEVWLMFVRNIGDEGYCSHKLWAAPFTRYTFRLPWRSGMISVEVSLGIGKTQFEGTAGTTGPSVSYVSLPGPDQGVYVTFTLPPPSQSPLIDGALHLKWTGRGQVETERRGQVEAERELPTVVADAESEEADEADEAEHKISAAISKLPLTQRRQVQNARAVVGARPVLHPLPPTAAAQRITALPAFPFPRIDERLGTSAGRATRKNERDAAQMRALCEATSNAPAGLPADVCTGVVRDRP